MPENWQENGFGLYLHWPFCAHKCPYCDFNSHVAQHIDQSAWQSAFLTDLEQQARATQGRHLRSIFFGGGTPSLMEPKLVEAILTKISGLWSLANDCEITLEANPTSVEAARFAAFAAAGVNRISMGVQALNDTDLRRLGRMHSKEEALRAFAIARAQFARVSFDLIYARQDQTRMAWQDELGEALALAVDHVSLYQLTIEDGTVFAARQAQGKLAGLPDEDLACALYEDTEVLCKDAGFSSYEVSNYARPGAEARHNLIYWQSGDYLGVGPGAHGRISVGDQRYATEAVRAPQLWLNKVLNGKQGSDWTALSIAEQIKEYVLMGLRLAEGIDQARMHERFGQTLPDEAIRRLVDWGLLQQAAHVLRSTAQGRLLLNSVITHLTEGFA